ncbi:kinase-like domain-containing protein [Echria macrotheca]|uniref:mitogen-activated protein kinase kinase n=1 Tax=Echria macrotheca TaxID=438768 RepID=A0AAJ0B4X1_9PEZI|nr:kinase-like domain-containing protein [Echria macrotheca]
MATSSNVWFSLVPLTPLAVETAEHERNKRYACINNGVTVLNVGHVISKAGPGTLATLGRGEASDIYLADETGMMSREQCSFEIDEENNMITLYDVSRNQTTQVYSDVIDGSEVPSFPFELGRERRVVVHPSFNRFVAIGKNKKRLIKFRLDWHHEDLVTKIQERSAVLGPLERDTRQAFTRLATEPDDDATLDIRTRIHAGTQPKLELRHFILGVLGAGSHAVVRKAVDVDTARLMAVKVIKKSDSVWEWQCIKREIEFLSHANHDNIVKFLGKKHVEPELMVFMDMYDGSLDGLLKSQNCPPRDLVANDVLWQMLCALDYVAFNVYVHRDLKPANILYKRNAKDELHFVLADFGLCNATQVAVGTRLYMAPELFKSITDTSSSKIDIWALFVTILQILNVQGFESMLARDPPVEDVHEFVAGIASDSGTEVAEFRMMGRLEVARRATAAQMLVRLYDGDGLTTPKWKVPGMPAESAEAEAFDEAEFGLGAGAGDGDGEGSEETTVVEDEGVEDTVGMASSAEEAVEEAWVEGAVAEGSAAAPAPNVEFPVFHYPNQPGMSLRERRRRVGRMQAWMRRQRGHPDLQDVSLPGEPMDICED